MAIRNDSSAHAKTFVAAVVIAGAAALFHSLYRLYENPTGLSWYVIAALTLLSGSFTIKVPSIPATISVSETFVFICVLLFGTPAATVTVALEALIMTSWRHRREFHKVLFNATEPTLSIWLASQIFFTVLGNSPGLHARDVSDLVFPVLALCVSYFLFNSFLTAIAISFDTKLPVFTIWKEHFSWLSLNYLAAASVAVLIVQNSGTVGMTTLGIILPLLLVSYLTMKSSLGRVGDANMHVAEVDRLYLSTIETLAMAVDAKDQVTHGHIRRVQSYAIRLAKELGLTDPQLLKAIEASALLHDMGKLAVPEHILNKPGKLTSAEFDQMKLHAGIGADILSAIDFPYPVVPIVRHHHENWNGTGYPDGLCGQDIPIGARILSVADCFDALTSDRPYRRKLSDEEALNILRERRATMYDPLIVDTFLNLVDQIRPADLPSPHEVALAEISRSTLSGARPYGSAKYIDSSDVVVADRRAKSSRTKATDRLLDLHLAKWFPNSTSVTYVLESSSNELVTRSATGSHAQALERKRIALGKGISGWVAANHRLIMNSDAALDLGDTIPEIAGHCCMSAPLIDAAGNLLGVLTIYSSSSTPFTDGDRSVLEAAAYAEVIALSSQVPGIRLEVSNVRQLPR